MTTVLNTLFKDAADGAPAATGLAQSSLTARRRIDRRRHRVLAVAGVAVLSLAGTAILDPTSFGSKPFVTVALAGDGTVAVGDTSCGTGEGYTEEVSLSEVPAGQRLVPAGGAAASQERASRGRDCAGRAAIPLALSLADGDGNITRALTVSGPLPAPLELGGQPASIRGEDGWVVVGATQNSGEATAATWTDADGRSWYVLASGFDRAALLRTIDALRIVGDSVTLPGTDMRDYGTSPARAAWSSVEWWAQFRGTRGTDFDVKTYQSTRTLVGDFLGPRGNSIIVDVAGQPGIVTSNGLGLGLGSGLQILSFELQPDVWVTVRAVDVEPAELVEFASTLKPERTPGA